MNASDIDLGNSASAGGNSSGWGCDLTGWCTDDEIPTGGKSENAGYWFWDDGKTGNKAVIDDVGDALPESELVGGVGGWICSWADCNEDGSVIESGDEESAIVPNN